VKLIAQVYQGWFQRAVRLVPDGTTYELMGRQPDIGTLVTLDLPGLTDASDAALERWIQTEYAPDEHRNAIELDDDVYRATTLADFLDADNAARFLAAIPHWWGVDALAQFASMYGHALLGDVRAALDAGTDDRTSDIAARTRRYAAVLGIADAGEVLDELTHLHFLEHLLGLEHALVRWIAAGAAVRTSELDALAHELPDDAASAGISDEWFRWWWRLARSCTRTKLHDVVAHVVAHADELCALSPRHQLAVDARREAHRHAERMLSLESARLWAGPPADVAVATIDRQPDAHLDAFLAVSHSAHAVAHALKEVAVGSTQADANRRAMRLLADIALKALR
jgi:hypothetical protein